MSDNGDNGLIVHRAFLANTAIDHDRMFQDIFADRGKQWPSGAGVVDAIIEQMDSLEHDSAHVWVDRGDAVFRTFAVTPPR